MSEKAGLILKNEGRKIEGLGVRKNYSVAIKKEGRWWIGWVEKIPGVNCQERTREELLETLRITLIEALAMNNQEALSAAGSDYSEVLLRI